jgi:hypothetical protein
VKDKCGVKMNDSNTSISNSEQAVFEAGIKLGALYHQFTGSPLNLETVDSLEEAISQSISVQPYVKNIEVTINRDMIRSRLNGEFGYCELEGCMLDVVLDVSYKEKEAQVSLKYDEKLNYPLMKIDRIKDSPE